MVKLKDSVSDVKNIRRYANFLKGEVTSSVVTMEKTIDKMLSKVDLIK